MTLATVGRLRLTARMATVMLGSVIVALLAFIGASSPLTGTVTLDKLWSVTGVITIILVTATVGLVVAAHQPRNPISWLLAGESAFMLLVIAGGSYTDLVYQRGFHDLSFAGPSALVLSQLFSYLLTGFPLVILLSRAPWPMRS